MGYKSLFYDYICLLECCFCIMRAIFLFFLTFFISYLFLSNLQVLSQHRKLELPYLDLWLHYKKHTLHCFRKVLPVLVQQCAQTIYRTRFLIKVIDKKPYLSLQLKCFCNILQKHCRSLSMNKCCWRCMLLGRIVRLSLKGLYFWFGNFLIISSHRKSERLPEVYG